MSEAGEHIAAWESAGVIDRATADRLRAAEGQVTEPLGRSHDSGPRGISRESGASALFGPSVAIAEVFGYLGGAFLLAAWFALVASMASDASNPEVVIGVGSGIAAAALAALGIGFLRGDERRCRAAGVAFVVAISAAGSTAGALAVAAGLDWPLVGVVGSAAALATSIALRWLHPSVLTQIGLLAALTSLAIALLAWFQELLFPSPEFTDVAPVAGTGPDPVVLVVASAAWWLAGAVLIGLIGLRESRASGRDAERTAPATADRRAGTSRLWAGLMAVIGLATAMSRSDMLSEGRYGRVLEPWVGDLALLIVSVVIIERAFRRGATSYIYPAALGLITALSDFNFTYLSDNTQTGLFVEGLILLGAGVAADRLRRRINRPDEFRPEQAAVPLSADSP